MNPNPTGRGGWPLVPSPQFPGESILACPDCGSTRVCLSLAPARVSVGGKTVSGFVSFDGDGTEFHAARKGRNAHKPPGEHAPAAYWHAAWKAYAEKGLARIYCGSGIRTMATEGHSMIDFLRPHALANLAWRNVATLARIHAKRYGWNLAECVERRRTPKPVSEENP